MRLFKPNTTLNNKYDSSPKIFLAGSIENGKAREWQNEVVALLEDLDVDIYNPRGDKWNPDTEQSIDNLNFHHQVIWELSNIEHADLVVFYFQSGTISPISLLELGYCAGSYTNTIVYCENGFFRKGNVDIVCDRYGIRQVFSMGELVEQVRDIVQKMS